MGKIGGGKKIRVFLLTIVLAVLVYGIVFVSKAIPILSGFGAKTLCSCVYLSNRSPSDVISKELGAMPLSLGSFSIHNGDSSATGSVLGMAPRKAIYREGLGCTLVSELIEEQIRSELPRLLSSGNHGDTALAPGFQLKDSLLSLAQAAKLNTAVSEAFREKGTDTLRRSRAVIVLHKGKIVAERYGDGFNQQTRHTGWSMTKSINSALIGILVKQGRLNITDHNLFPEWSNDKRKNITIDQLLHANSGLKWDEEYATPSPATNMLFMQSDMGRYASSYELEFEPGTRFEYSSGSANMLAYIIRTRTGSAYYQFPYDELFRKIGMSGAVMEPDASGTFVGSSYCFATPRDWARFGLLYLNDGVANGERILPMGWVSYTTTPAKGALLGEYGAQFWLNAGAPGDPARRSYPSVPADCFWADGYEGQSIWIIPSKQLVVVRLALQQGNRLNEDQFLAEIIAALN
ncbi:serine hydrolase domain-containing protein [Segetibacter sp. 3557_3]|uniref:serine hydrolase domain-containing protein n=1 Tax=Segetibacter sp. 3557_3 TaxID=2547429 RepID=UPI0014043A43|nr:serine hydrolase [Segetibacter sp. 3557_3]